MSCTICVPTPMSGPISPRRHPATVRRLLGLIDAALARHGGRVIPGAHAQPGPPDGAAPQTAANITP